MVALDGSIDWLLPCNFLRRGGPAEHRKEG
jgi:hypothetical protein